MKRFLALLLSLIFMFSCGRSESTDAVATVGSRQITLADVERSRWLNPQYMNRTSLQKVREAQLNYLVEDQYYFLAAKAAQLADSADLREKLAYIEKREAVSALINRQFVEETRIEDIELIQAYAKYQKEIHLKHLFVKSAEEARTLRRRLEAGAPFDQLASEVFEDEYLKNNGGDLGYVGFGKIAPEIEAAMYRLKPGEISRPIETAYGFHILLAGDARENEAANSTPAPMVNEMLRNTIKNRKIDLKIREYLGKIARNQKIEINNRLVNVLLEQTQTVMKDKFNTGDVFATPINDGEIQSIRLGSDDIAGREILKFAGETMTAGQFLSRLKQMPPYHRPYLNGRQRLMQSMIDMVRNDLLFREAEKAGLPESAEVREKIMREKESLLVREFRRRHSSADYRESHPRAWQIMDEKLRAVRKKHAARKYAERLFLPSENPDSLVDKPIPMFFKNRYAW